MARTSSLSLPPQACQLNRQVAQPDRDSVGPVQYDVRTGVERVLLIGGRTDQQPLRTQRPEFIEGIKGLQIAQPITCEYNRARLTPRNHRVQCVARVDPRSTQPQDRSSGFEAQAIFGG